MAVSAIVAAVSTGVGVVAGSIAIGAAFKYFLISTAMGAALNALTPKPNISAASRGYNLRGESGAALDHQIVYGEARVGGVRVYDASTGNNNQFLHRILAFAGHEIDSYQEIYLNDEVVTLGTINVYSYAATYFLSFDGSDPVPFDATSSSTVDLPVGPVTREQLNSIGINPDVSAVYVSGEITSKTLTTSQEGAVVSPAQYVGKVRIKTYLGTNTQTADPDLVAETASLTDGKWTSSHRLQGIAYVYARFEYNQDAFPNGVPALSVKIRGKKVFDARTGVTAWSDNPALCIRDYLTSAYGLSQLPIRIDDSLVVTAANICDQTVESEKRYTCNGSFTTGAAPSDILTNLLTSMGGILWYGQGKWRMKASSWTTPTVTFDENDLRSGISLSTRHSRRDNFNSVKGTFAGNETDWQITDYPQVSDPAFLIADNNLPNVLDFSLPFTASSKTAQRVARIALNRNREQLTFSAAFGMKAFQVQVGDFVYINNTRFGWSNKAFEIVEWNFGLTDGLDLHINMTLREISEGVFTGAPGETFELNNTTLPSIFAGLTVTNLIAGQKISLTSGGVANPFLDISWTAAPSIFVERYEVVVTPFIGASPQPPNIISTSGTSVEVPSIGENLAYTITVRAFTGFGNGGPIASVTVGANDILSINLILSNRNFDGSIRPIPGIIPQYSVTVDAPMILRQYLYISSPFQFSTSDFATVGGWTGGSTITFDEPNLEFFEESETVYTTVPPTPTFIRQFPVGLSTVWGASAKLIVRISKTLL